MNLGIICQQVKDVAVLAGEFIQNERIHFSKSKIETKGEHDFVSYVDREAEKQIVNALRQILPEAGFLTEEATTSSENKTYNWIIDPLDGTTNYIHNVPPFAVSIALMHKDKLVLGVVYEIVKEECFYAWEGSPAYLNGEKINVSTVNDMNTSLIATGFPYYDYKLMAEYMLFLEYLMRNTSGIRRPGSAAADLVYVACGRFDAFYEYSLHAWDVAAGAFIVQQAGGIVTDFQNKNNYIFGGEIIATNKNIYKTFSQLTREHFIQKKKK
jgi:myo-inositol-1(or 4)-monophosphatase